MAFSRKCENTKIETEFSLLLQTNKDQQRDFLVCNTSLNLSTAYKAQDMIDNNYIAHISPSGEYPNELAQRFGCEFSFEPKANYVESILVGTGNPQVALNHFLSSSKHREHLLGESDFFRQFTYIGIAMIEGNNNFYWVIHIANC